MLRFISFGSGSSGNCYYLYTDTEGLLIDAGVGIRSLKKFFKDYGLSFSLVQNVLVTHDHADHIKCVGSISYEHHLPVYATKKVHDGIERNYCVVRKVAQELKFLMEPEVSKQIGPFKVTPFTVPHDSSDNVGYQIEAEGVVFCLITDVGSITPTIQTYINRADYLVIEANHDLEMLMQGPYPQHLKERITSGTGHLNNTLCGQAIAEHAGPQLKHVWLAHLSEENNHPELARKTVESVLRSYGIVAGHDFELDVLKRTKPTGIFDLVQ